MFMAATQNPVALSVLFVPELGSHCVTQAGLELLGSSDPPALASQATETADTQLNTSKT